VGQWPPDLKSAARSRIRSESDRDSPSPVRHGAQWTRSPSPLGLTDVSESVLQCAAYADAGPPARAPTLTVTRPATESGSASVAGLSES
jgi:hypothetical protein